MSAAPTLSTPTAAPTGAEADRLTPSHHLLLIIIRMLIAWAEGSAASLRQRTETTDIALTLQRITCALQRLRALEHKVLRSAVALDPDRQRNPMGAAAASPRLPSAPQPPRLKPAIAPLHTPERTTAIPVRATGPPPNPSPSLRKPPTGPAHPLTPRGMAGPVVPIHPLPRVMA